MQAQVDRVKVLREHLQYHEQKLKQGKAECLLAENFIKDTDALTLDDMVYHFERLNSLNQRTRRKNLDISLNFHPGDLLTKTDLSAIAKSYMEKIGYSEQPYLVYRHLDSAHPHVHIVTTHIGREGKNLVPKPRDLRLSRRICAEMEEKYALVVSGKGMTKAERQSDTAQKIIYGQVPVMPALSKVINRVVPNYKYTNLDELNAVLGLYNVETFRGNPDSQLYRLRGVLYRVLYEDGQPTGSQIKASLFDSKPTLKRLERHFLLNKLHTQREQHRVRIQMAVDKCLFRESVDLTGLQQRLAQERVSLVLQKDKEGIPQNVFYVDHLNQSVFSGKGIGERYDLPALTERCAVTQNQRQELQEIQNQRQRQTERLRQGQKRDLI